MTDKDIELTVKMPDIDVVRATMKGMEDKAPIAMRNAINRTISAMGGFIAKEVSGSYVVKQSAVTKTLKRHKARVRDLTGLVESNSSTAMPLIGFRVSPAKERPRPDVYSVKVKRKSKAKPLIGNSERSKAFMEKMKTKHKGLFQRKLGEEMDNQQRINPKTGLPVKRRSGSKPYTKIVEMHSTSIPQMIGSKESAKVIRDKAFLHLRERLDHEIKWIMKEVK